MKDFVGFASFLSIMFLSALGTIGWVLNIVHVIQTVSGPITALFILRVVGIFAIPLGAILGWIS